MGDTKVRPLCTHRKNDQSEDLGTRVGMFRRASEAIALFIFAELGTTH